MLYMCTVAPGIEAVVESEIQTKLPGAWIQATFRGRILFGSMLPVDELMTLRCIDNLYAHIAWLHVGPHKADLKHLADAVSSVNIANALSLLPGVPPKPKVFVSASRSGKHSYSRFDAADAVFAALRKEHDFAQGSLHMHDLAFRLDIMDANALLSLKLTPPAFRFRGEAHGFTTAALRPPLAHALVWVSAPDPGDVFFDPFCGSGAIVAERAAYPVRRLIGSDISAAAVDVARKNAPEEAEIHKWDACHSGLAAQSVNCVVTNPPWGNQICAGADLGELYKGFLAEMKRVVVPDGRIILLTDQVDTLQQSCQMLDMPCEILHRVSLHGLVPAVFSIRPGY